MRTMDKSSGNNIRILIIGLTLLIYTGSLFSQLSYEITLQKEDNGFEIILGNIHVIDFGKAFVVGLNEQFSNDIVFEKDVSLEQWMLEKESWINVKNNEDMEFEHVEEQLALEAWMIQAFKLEDKILEEDLKLEEWMLADTDWVGRN